MALQLHHKGHTVDCDLERYQALYNVGRAKQCTQEERQLEAMYVNNNVYVYAAAGSDYFLFVFLVDRSAL